MIVVDASVVASALIDDGEDGDRCRARLSGETLVAPALIDLEVLSVIRRLASGGSLSSRRADFAVVDLADLTMQRVPHPPLIARCWQLRENLTTYDAAYVAVAELFGVTLVTGDLRLSRAPGLRCEVELVG